MQNKENKNNEIQFEIKIQQYFCFSLQVNAFSLFQKDISLIDQTCQSNEYFFFFFIPYKSPYRYFTKCGVEVLDWPTQTQTWTPLNTFEKLDFILSVLG